MTESEKNLYERAKKASERTMTNTERAAQRESFAYGNTKIENERITREMIHAEAMNVDRQLIEE